VRVVVAGGSGFLGRALVASLAGDGHQVSVLTRRPRAGVTSDVGWTPDGSVGPWASALDGVDLVINLAGEGIADKRWSSARKQVLRDSRLLATRSIVLALHRPRIPPPVFVSGSAVGYYGPRGDDALTEDSPAGDDFLSHLAVEWEREAEPVPSATRLAVVRTGIVLHPDGGALKQMLTPFRLGLGGRLGSGRQQMSWIHRDDWIRLVRWIGDEPRAAGAFNLTAPAPVTNAEFTRTLGRVLGRPAFMSVPIVALRVLFGELSDTLVTGQRAIPAHAERLGFEFRFRQLERALVDLL
jgi:uncharacterized protein (TIGR01777 family)